ncbi:MAG: class I SAM-dependent methyltransferase [Pseudomonadota bacterium]
MPSLWNTPLLGPLVFSVWCADARRKLDLIAPWLSEQDRLLEIGSGPGSVLREFRKAGYSIDALDVADSSYDETLKPHLYDGSQMPFADGAYDTALLLTVLHHIADPEPVLLEAMRAARRVIIIEDVYDTAWQRKYTKVADSITNLEFIGHPHSNRSDAEWRETFSRLGFELQHASVHRLASVFQQAVYVVE